ncbi:GNAT family N-acetyltransferase [Streptomyces sp. NBC_01498]|uniref:GNAT family N-acetyltransferase n=1 Tax=Streptomyces sp. NBC_01498 TaxID=2975870 RepID=UPI002E7B0999|nr:GNAT family protein [Streptomyces sp. NBC_01498]WTL24485.1 GNAT family N-acetyltransferase [Streptomyces sp. NBC_01498]
MFAVSLGDDGAELRPLEPWQAEEFLAHMDRARDLVDQHVRLAQVVTDLGSARAMLVRYAESQAADGGRLYGIWLDGTLVGGVMFRLFDADAGTCEVGCWLEPAATGRGLVTRAVRVIVDWAVERRGIHRVEWVVSSANLPSVRTAERLGLRREGVLRESSVHHGKRQDNEIWSVLAPEWRELRGTTG